MKRDKASHENIAGDKVDNILSMAKARPVPDHNRKAVIFEGLRSEWLAGQRARKAKHRFYLSGIAATIVAATALMMQVNFEADSPALPPDATIVRSTGAGTTINNQELESLLSADETFRFTKGDKVATGNNAALAIAWGTTGSLRVNSSSAITLQSLDHIELAAGEIYYDSRVHGATDASVISVDTPLGTIRHVGTQFLARVDRSSVNISVREGQVEFGRRHDNIIRINEGETVRIDRALAPVFSTADPTDDSWQWTSAIAPRFNIDGRSSQDVILWYSRETGRVVEYADKLAETYAANDEIRGIGEVGPLDALTFIQIATDLRLDIDDHAIRVRLVD